MTQEDIESARETDEAFEVLNMSEDLGKKLEEASKVDLTKSSRRSLISTSSLTG